MAIPSAPKGATNRPDSQRDKYADPTNHAPSTPFAAPQSRIEQVAELVASGQLPFTALTDDTDRLLVLERVAQKRRHDLIRVIAQAIAKDVIDSRQEPME